MRIKRATEAAGGPQATWASTLRPLARECSGSGNQAPLLRAAFNPQWPQREQTHRIEPVNFD